MTITEKTMTNASYPTSQQLYAKICGFIRDNDVIVSDWNGFLCEYLCEESWNNHWEDEDNVWRNDDVFIERMVTEIADLFGISID